MDEQMNDMIQNPLIDVCLVFFKEGVKFRVLCEEPGTALHLLMEVRSHILFLFIDLKCRI